MPRKTQLTINEEKLIKLVREALIEGEVREALRVLDTLDQTDQELASDFANGSDLDPGFGSEMPNDEDEADNGASRTKSGKPTNVLSIRSIRKIGEAVVFVDGRHPRAANQADNVFTGSQLVQLHFSGGAMRAAAATKSIIRQKQGDHAPVPKNLGIEWQQGGLSCSLVGSGTPLKVELEFHGEMDGVPRSVLWANVSNFEKQEEADNREFNAYPIVHTENGKLTVEITRRAFMNNLKLISAVRLGEIEVDLEEALPVLLFE